MDNISTVVLQIKAHQSELTKSENQVADFIINQPDEVIHLSVSGLAQASETSDATVIRACKKLGFSSYQEFKVELAQSLVSPIQTIRGDINDCDSAEEIVAHVFDNSIQTLQVTKELNQFEELDKAASLIQSANRVFIFGMGNSAAIVIDLQHKLMRLGITAITSNDSHMQRLMIAGLAAKGDILFAISHSGSSKDIIDTAHIAKKQGAKIISITNMGKSPLSEISDICLYTLSDETKYNLTAIASRYAQMVVIDSLTMLLSLKDKTTNKKRIDNINKAMSSLKL